MKKHAVALRAFTHGDDAYAKDQTILGLDGGLFADWSAPGADMVREATAAEIAREKREPASKAEKPAAKRKPRAAAKKAAAAETAPSVPANPNPAADAA